ncbi:MAG: hypothetical protein KGS45_05315 [Planctomycetes bacterium]|nr:hypothetical protein [Planctomycetota bacterium]
MDQTHKNGSDGPVDTRGVGESSIVSRYKAEAGSMALMLVLLGAATYFMGLKWPLVVGFGVCILMGPAWPPKWSWLGTLLGMLGLAALAYFKYSNQQIAAIFAVMGVIFAVMRWRETRR